MNNEKRENIDEGISRKDFILGNASIAALITASLAVKGSGSLFAQSSYPDLVAVKGENPDDMVETAVNKIGGMERFVKKGQTVLIKPNIGWDVGVNLAANTNPMVVKRLVEMCFKAGAKSVTVCDHTCDRAERAYLSSGIEKSAKDAGANVIHVTAENAYRNISIPNGVALKNTKMLNVYMDSDVIINVPILKHHSGARLTMAMKNLMGVVWDRGAIHRAGLQQAIADISLAKKPTLNIVDAYRVLTRNGPRGASIADVQLAKTILASTDIVAIDTAAALLVNRSAAEIPHITLGEKHGLGTTNLNAIKIERVTI